jgi:pyridoxine kinase
MVHLAEQADVIVPNLTEAALLLGIPYGNLPTGEDGCREIVERLSLEGRRSVVLTGASTAPDLTGAMCFDAKSGRTKSIQVPRVPREFYGTGDVFASVLAGALVKGTDLPEATRQAVDFVRACAERTAEQDLPIREGVDFEPLLGLLTGGNR